MPALSVVMPVRNAISYLDEAVESIVAQTFGDFEFLIGDDGSTDGSGERLEQWAMRDPRIRLIRRSGPALGPAGSADWVARLAHAPFVARMDADDISHGSRLERQLKVLWQRPDAVLVATQWEGIDCAGTTVHGRDCSRLTGSGMPFMHGSIMYRREAFERAGGYRAGSDYWEESDMLRRIAALGTILVIPDALYRYRWSPSSCRFHDELHRVETEYQVALRAARSPLEHVTSERIVIWRQEASRNRVDPILFLGFGYGRVWSGKRAGILLRLLRRGALRLDAVSARTLLWAVAGALIPRVLRSLLQRRMARRDRATQWALNKQAWEWHPPHHPNDVRC